MLNKYLPLTSLSNPKYKELLAFKENGKKFKKAIVEGEDLVQLAIQKGKLEKVILLDYSYQYKDYEQLVLSKELYKSLSSYNSLPKVMGLCSFDLSEDLTDQVIYLDNIQDPGNLGTIMRSALAFNFKTIVLSPDSVSPFNFKAVQASKGALFYLNISYRSLESLHMLGYKLVVTVLDGKDISLVKKPEVKYAVVIGNEGQGIKKENIALGDLKVKLPINPIIDSLNAGIAASIFMYLWRNN